MMLTPQLRSGAIGLAVGALVFGLALAGIWQIALLSVAVGALWWFAQRQGWGALGADLGLLYCLGTAMFGIWWEVGAGWMLGASVAALAAWDLHHFGLRVQEVARVEDAPTLERHHLRRLGIVLAVGGVLGTMALVVRVQLRFIAVFFLVLLAVGGLSRLVAGVQRAGD
jgi:hypothetical protein